MAGNLLFYYFGDDEAYFKTLQGEFKNSTKLVIDFKRVFETEEKKIQALFLKVAKTRPACVFIDFSKNTQDYLHLARIITRTPLEHKFVTVGLVDYLSPPEVLMESIATGVHLTHIKSAESFDVVFDVTKLISPKEMGEHGFASIALKESLEAGFPVKVGYIHAEGLHFETDYQLNPGDRIILNHFWTVGKVVPSREMFIQKISTKNLFYHFSRAIDAEFLFVDEFLPPEGMELERIEEKRKEREESILHYRKQLSRWIEDNSSRSLEKKAKVLVVDRDFKFYDNQPRTDKHLYTIRPIPYFDDIGKELERMEPQVIAFAFDSKETKEPKNTEAKLEELIRYLKDHAPEDQPFIVVFNCESSSKDIQDRNGYAHIMATKNELSVDIMLRMAEIFDKKLEEKRVMKKSDVQKVFLRKTNPASLAEIVVPITVLKISETDMTFQTEKVLPIGANLHLTAPVDMCIHVLPSKNQGKTPEYYGLIHCLGEVQKKELRKFVNSVFFRDHDAQIQSEKDEFKKLNEAKLQEKQKTEEAAAEAGDTKEPEKSET